MSVKIQSYNAKGDKQTETIDWLSRDQVAKPALIVQVVRAFLGNNRRGSAKAKTRGQVEGTTKKIYKQKGTGGARHGSRKAPIFVGGGKAHGPCGNQNYSAQVNKKVIHKALLSTLVDKQSSGRLSLVDVPEFTKSNQAASYFSAILSDNKCRSGLLLVDSQKDTMCTKYCRNLDKITVVSANTVSVYAIIRCEMLLLSSLSLPILKQRGRLQ